jgi:hypothetical protein
MYSGTKNREGKRFVIRSECVLQRWQNYHNIAPLSRTAVNHLETIVNLILERKGRKCDYYQIKIKDYITVNLND